MTCGGSALTKPFHIPEIETITMPNHRTPIAEVDVVTLDATLNELRRRAKLPGQDSEYVSEGLRTGLAELDGLIGDIPLGTMLVAAGRPSMGKRHFALATALSAINQQRPMLYFSLGQSRLQLAAMLAELAVDIDYRHLLSGMTRAEDCEKFDDWRNQIFGTETSAPLYIDDTPAPDIGYIRTCIEQLPMERGVIVLDSINEMTPLYCQGSAENTHHDLMNDLRWLAKEMDVVMIVMSSLDRGLEDRFDKRPRSDDLPSLALLAFCDLLLLFYRDEIYHPTSRGHGITEIIVAKNRIGSGVGVCHMHISDQ